MFIVTDAAAAIRIAFKQAGELSAAAALRRRFPGIADNAHARPCARSIAGWRTVPVEDLVEPFTRTDTPILCRANGRRRAVVQQLPASMRHDPGPGFWEAPMMQSAACENRL